MSFMYIAEKNSPNFRVLSDFRKSNGDFFQECLKQTVKLTIEIKFASLGHVSLDGSKFKANSSKHKTISYKMLKEKETVLCLEVEALIKQANACDAEEDEAYKEKKGYELPEDLKFKQQRLAKIKDVKKVIEAREQTLESGKKIDDKKQISFAESDARIMGKTNNFDYRYNGQISVDVDNQIIVDQHLSQNANDKQEVEKGLNSLKESAGKLSKIMSLNNGYQLGGNLEAFEQSTVEAYIAIDRGEKNHREPLEDSSRSLYKLILFMTRRRAVFIARESNRSL
ncbi:MAG: transposase [Pseudohongiellaceae bacterium]|jgi:transposase